MNKSILSIFLCIWIMFINIISTTFIRVCNKYFIFNFYISVIFLFRMFCSSFFSDIDIYQLWCLKWFPVPFRVRETSWNQFLKLRIYYLNIFAKFSSSVSQIFCVLHYYRNRAIYGNKCSALNVNCQQQWVTKLNFLPKQKLFQETWSWTMEIQESYKYKQ